MQMARLIGTTVLRRKFRRVRAIAGDRRARLDPAAAAARASLAAMVALILSCFFIWGGGGGLAWAQTAGVEDLGSPVHHVVVTLHKSRTLRVDRPFSTTVIGSPEIADVLPMTDTTFYVQGKRGGTTNISVFDWERHLLAVIDLEVTPDTATLHSNIVATTGGENINVTSANGQVVLSGEANDAVGAARAVEVAKGLSPNAPVINALRISPSQQVMLKVRILEVDRSAGRDLGVNWFGANKYGLGVSGLGALPNSATAVQSTLTTSSTGTGGVASTTANIAGNSIGVSGSSVASSSGTSLTGVPLLSSVFPGAAATAAPFGALLAQVINTHGLQIDTLISALEEKGLVKSLAEPDLVALGRDGEVSGGRRDCGPRRPAELRRNNGHDRVEELWRRLGVHPDRAQRQHHQFAARSLGVRARHRACHSGQWHSRSGDHRPRSAYFGGASGWAKLRHRRPSAGAIQRGHFADSLARQRAGPWRPVPLDQLPKTGERPCGHRLPAHRAAGAARPAAGDAVRHHAAGQRHRPLPHGRYGKGEALHRLCGERRRSEWALWPYPSSEVMRCKAGATG